MPSGGGHENLTDGIETAGSRLGNGYAGILIEIKVERNTDTKRLSDLLHDLPCEGVRRRRLVDPI
jgi:hypothetical protein